MFEIELDRRRLLQSAATAGALAFAPPLLARSAPRWATVGALFDSYIKDDRVPGAVGAIGRGTAPADFIARGTLARGSTVAMSADSLFRCYSMTKPITGIATMLLVEDGKLKLDQNVADFIPTFANPRVIVDQLRSLETRPATRPVTIRGLLTHSGGVGYEISVKGALLDEYRRQGLVSGVVSRMQLPGFPKVAPAPSLAAFAERIGTMPLVAEPGTRWSYSAGLDVLGRVIELASGMSFDAFLQARLFGPLGMTSSFFRVPPSEFGRMTTNYGVLGAAKLPIDPGVNTIYSEAPPYLMGGSGLVMSPRDYDRFLLMLAGRGRIGRTRVMQEATARLAMSNLLPAGVDTSNTPVAGQGFGAGGRVTIARSDRLGAGLGTYGWGGAAATVAWVDPTRAIRAAGFVQYMPDSAMPFTREFGQAVYAS